MKAGRWLVATALLLPTVGFFSAKAATTYVHGTQALAGQWVLPPLPEAGSLLLVGTAFLGLASLARRRKESDADEGASS